MCIVEILERLSVGNSANRSARAKINDYFGIIATVYHSENPGKTYCIESDPGLCRLFI